MNAASLFNEIEALKEVCEQEGQFQLKLNEDMMRDRKEDAFDFFHFEGEQLVGFLGLYGFASTVEVCGMVHPDYRNQGIFTKLFEQAMNRVIERQFKKVLLNTPASSITGKRFIENLGATHSHTEHQMTLRPKPLDIKQDILLRPAFDTDTQLIALLDHVCFDMPLDDAITWANDSSRRGVKGQFIIVWNNKDVGKIRVKMEHNEAWIYGFAILPEYQGKGIGRDVLKKVIGIETGRGNSVHLEVETENENALKLYKDVGFEVVHAQVYYDYKL
ncbi:GNAT family N-acetyltransferase [Paenisporosarcina cavernae]|uniref:GNAT family N-acetyltransferase n=1 Tax=Paenisporosarcina cavernae TaxID=2320858 RepID=A0A385YQJ1_9BACL|nr:GNAT family N-acetyltransferase [Paenisporosarcina cavernae]AYC28630.1 GNAT family N-acetyltransferase [Paenisporosarcina cavernae]